MGMLSMDGTASVSTMGRFFSGNFLIIHGMIVWEKTDIIIRYTTAQTPRTMTKVRFAVPASTPCPNTISRATIATSNPDDNHNCQ